MKRSLVVISVLWLMLSIMVLGSQKKESAAVVPGVDITVQGYSLYSDADSSGNFRLRGEVINNGDTSAVFVKVTINAYDAGSQLLDSGIAYISGGTAVEYEDHQFGGAMAPGDTGFFETSLRTPFAGVDSYTYEVSYDTATPHYPNNARLDFQDQPALSDVSGNLQIDGTIANPSNYLTTYYTKVVVAVYNSSGQVLDVETTYVDGITFNGTDSGIAPEGTATFSLETEALFSSYASVKYSILWSEEATGTVPRITVTSPNGGEQWEIFSTHDITWDTVGTVDMVSIEYSDDNGTTWYNITAYAQNTGRYLWSNTQGSASDQCLIRVRQYPWGAPSDTSDAVFSLTEQDPPFLWVNRDYLYFTSFVGGNNPVDQTFTVSNTGGRTLNWTASENAEYIKLSPGSGSNTGIVTVSINPNGLAVGTYTETITVNAPDSTNGSRTITVSLTVKDPADDEDPFGVFATPTDGDTVRSSIAVTGWALDDAQMQGIKIYREQNGSLVFIGDAVFVEGARPDIENLYQSAPASYKAGWGYMLLTNFLPNGGNGTYTLHAVITDSEGQEHTLDTKTIICDNENAVKPFGAIDTPTQGGIASGNDFINWGWVLTPQPNSIPTDGSTISVWVDGVQLGNPHYNIYRTDIATLFPGYANSDGAVGYYSLDTTVYENGVHSIHWLADDDAGNRDGIGSRYFQITNSGSDTFLQDTNTATTNSVTHKKRKPYRIGRIKNPPATLSEISQIHFSTAPILVQKGFHSNIQPQMVPADDTGSINVEMQELSRIQIDLQQKGLTGYMVVGKKLKRLPIGSTMNHAEGIFHWQPGVAFVGTYEFVFLDINKTIGKRIKICVVPK